MGRIFEVEGDYVIFRVFIISCIPGRTGPRKDGVVGGGNKRDVVDVPQPGWYPETVYKHGE